MDISRRRFLEASVLTGAGLATGCGHQATRQAASAEPHVIPAPKGEWMAATPASAFRAYRSKLAKAADAPTWVQIDLGASHPIDSVKLYPANERMYPGRDEYYAGEGYPVRFKIEVADEPDFHAGKAIVDHTGSDNPNPDGAIRKFPAGGTQGRYIRLTATRLMRVEGARVETGVAHVFPAAGYFLALARVEVYSHGRDIASQRPVTVDAVYGNDNDAAQLTRLPRAGGEGVFMDNRSNVTEPSTWKRPEYKAQRPLGGVTVDGGLFQTAMENNIGYLLNSYTVDELLRQFRTRAGKPNPPNLPPVKTVFWEDDLAGSNAGRFLMGAGNTVRWINDPELRRRLNAVVDGIAECREPDDYIMAYPKDTIFFSERGAYTRAWLTHGLIEAGYAGNHKAFELLRGYYDWFNHCSYLPYMLRFAIQGGQGMIANTRLALTPVGKPADIQVIQRYFQENFWLDQLAAREERAVWQYPYDRPHCYLLTDFEAYMDVYLATGDPRYLRAVEGARELFHNKWINEGGSTAIIEFVVCPPSSYRLRAKLEELCGNSFWAFLNQRFHLLNPDQEKYVSEIERSIYNVALANQAGSHGLRYHAVLTHQKEKPTEMNTCCEGQGTRLIGSLPEHIYSIAPDGLYVNLFEPSTIRWKQGGEPVSLKMATRFPFENDVQLAFSSSQPVRAKIRVRVPSWAAHEMAIEINGRPAATGQPGSYVALDRTWANGDSVAFTLPAALRAMQYTGVDQIPECERYAFEYGPILLAAVGAPEVRLRVGTGKRPESLLKLLNLKSDQPLHYTVEDNPGIEFMPYWQVDTQPFNCLPAVTQYT